MPVTEIDVVTPVGMGNGGCASGSATPGGLVLVLAALLLPPPPLHAEMTVTQQQVQSQWTKSALLRIKIWLTFCMMICLK
jgi:hypothetical protein